MIDDVRITVDSAEGLSRRLRVEVPAARVAREVEARLKSAGASINLKGFRPGKIPQNVMRQRFGDQARREVIQEVVQSSLAEALAREKFRPVTEPRIEMSSDPAAENVDLAFTASFEILPEFEVQGLRDIPVGRLTPAMDDADVDFVIDNLRHQRATLLPVSREARDGDRVTLTFSGSIDGHAIPGAGQPISLTLGAGRMGADIERQLVGLRPGEERAVRAALGEFPAGPALAGRLADLQVRVTDVAEEQLPEVDEKFIRSFDVETGNRDEFVTLVRQYMRDEFEFRSVTDVRRQILAYLLDKNPIGVPGVLVDQETASMQAEAGKPGAPPVSRQAAENRVRLNLINAAIVREQGLVVDHARVRARIDELASDQANPDEFRNRYFQTPALLAQVESEVLNEQVLDWLGSKAVVTDIPTNFRSLKDR